MTFYINRLAEYTQHFKEIEEQQARTVEAIQQSKRQKVEREEQIVQATKGTVEQIGELQALISGSIGELQNLQQAVLQANTQTHQSIETSVKALQGIEAAMQNAVERLITAQNNPPLMPWLKIGILGGLISGTMAGIVLYFALPHHP